MRNPVAAAVARPEITTLISGNRTSPTRDSVSAAFAVAIVVGGGGVSGDDDDDDDTQYPFVGAAHENAADDDEIRSSDPPAAREAERPTAKEPRVVEACFRQCLISISWRRPLLWRRCLCSRAAGSGAEFALLEPSWRRRRRQRQATEARDLPVLRNSRLLIVRLPLLCSRFSSRATSIEHRARPSSDARRILCLVRLASRRWLLLIIHCRGHQSAAIVVRSTLAAAKLFLKQQQQLEREQCAARAPRTRKPDD